MAQAGTKSTTKTDPVIAIGKELYRLSERIHELEDRGAIVVRNPVVGLDLALLGNIAVLQPERLNDPGFLAALSGALGRKSPQ